MSTERTDLNILRIAMCLMILGSMLPLVGCHSTPISDRRQLVLVPEQTEITLGMQAYEEILKDEKLSSNPHYVELVERVGHRIAAVAGHDEFDWEFRVIESPTMNAFALPGGKVAVYEGILSICENEAGLAVVMSHEIAHAIARHGGERMTQQGVVTAAGKVVDLYSKDKEKRQQDRIRAVFGAASQYGYILPYSRKHESEADQIGLILMARAGYDPSEAPKFWQRFSKQGGEKPPEFMSTHPADERRAAELQEMLPEALAEYEQAPQKYALGKPIFDAGNLLGNQRQQIMPASSLSAPGSSPQPETADPFLGK